MPARTYQNYEGNVRSPNTEAWECFVRAGINANWLLTGEGPMLLADLALKPVEVPATPAWELINFNALGQALSAMQTTAPPGESPVVTARRAIQMYRYMAERGMIGPEGFTAGDMDSAA